jgi:cupredoxin-like protein
MPAPEGRGDGATDQADRRPRACRGPRIARRRLRRGRILGTVEPHPAVASEQPQPHGEPITGPVPCKPHGAALTIAASQQKFSADCLAAPADESFTIRFMNQEPTDAPVPGAVRHNMGIYTSTSADQEIFGGSVTSPGDTVVYHLDALPRGLYYFQCDLHHFMHGTFVVT